jgi:hypothetical protein
MTSAGIPVAAGCALFRHSRWDALLVALAVGHGALLLAVPAAPVIALGLWWNSNTVAHYFLHKPFFRSRVLNGLFAMYLSVLLGVPQALWRERHLAHHAGIAWRCRLGSRLAAETALVVGLWALLLFRAPAFFLTAYVPGYLAGLALCWLHGHYEHTRGTTSHYGTLYNLLFFNDGYHAEHHRHPGEHWTHLPRRIVAEADTSRWPAVLRWLDIFSLETLERCVLRSSTLQRFVLDRHERAFRALLPHLPAVQRICVVGGALFPRTLLVLRRLLPEVQILAIDQNAENIRTARPLAPQGIEFIHAFYDPGRPHDFDVVVVPLAYVGDREALYRRPPAPALLVHDWIWRRRGTSAIVSPLLLKRLNLVKPCAR